MKHIKQVALLLPRGSTMLCVIPRPRLQSFIIVTLLLLQIYHYIQLNAVRSVVFGVTLMLLVINTSSSSSIKNKCRHIPAISVNNCQTQFVTAECIALGCQTVSSTWWSQLSVPRHNLEFGSRAFRISAPKIWNLLPASIRNAPSIPTFRRHLKTHYFPSAYANP